ncbi:MAG TPA: hypothetical protein VGK61_00795 [Planctomycetota bacterium]
MRALAAGLVTVAFWTQQAPPGGAGWTKDPSSPVLLPGTPGAFDEAGVFPGPVVRNGITYRLWFTGIDHLGRERIGLATSTDLLNWTKHLANPIIFPGPAGAWDAAGTGQATIHFDGINYRAWYRGLDAAGVGRVGLATSNDGINFTKSPMNPVLNVGGPGAWDAGAIHSVHVISDGNGYRMWYAASDASGLVRFGSAASTNGTTWTRTFSNPEFDPGSPGEWDEAGVASPRVLRDGMGWRLWYTGLGVDGRTRVGYADSPDGHGWTRGPANPVISEGLPGSWDEHSVYVGGTILEDGFFKMWYGGRDLFPGGTPALGFAAAAVPPPPDKPHPSTDCSFSPGAAMPAAFLAALLLLILVSRPFRR